MTFGFAIDNWRTMPMYRASSVGAFPSDNRNWDPDRWKPRIPNAAFLRAGPDDKFWAARKLQALTPDMLTAVVNVGRFADEPSEAAVARFLIERRDAILRKYLVGINPIVDPKLETSGALTFANAAVDAGVADLPRGGYKITWFSFDNSSGEATAIGETIASEPRVQAPAALASAAATYVKVEISAVAANYPSWAVPVHVYFARQANGWKLVGLERLP